MGVPVGSCNGGCPRGPRLSTCQVLVLLLLQPRSHNYYVHYIITIILGINNVDQLCLKKKPITNIYTLTFEKEIIHKIYNMFY